jgi:2,3-bisphosphoglycerate-independent phosphoglycerate mutase
MKYVILLCDGMADYKLEKLGNKTPMTVSDKPAMNALAKKSTVGLVRTVARGLNPGSDVANLSVLGYDPFKYYSGRSPLEAASIGIKLDENDIAMRINLVTLSDEENYEDKTMVDYCADDISTKEASEIIKTLKDDGQLPHYFPIDKKMTFLEEKFINKMSELSSHYVRISREDEEILEKLFKKYL